MANMSYCRFENTVNDFYDCLTALQDALDEGQSLEEFKAGLSSLYERNAFAEMAELVGKFTETLNQFEETADV